MVSIFEKHLGKVDPLVIEGTEFIIKPFGLDEMPMFFRAAKSLMKFKGMEFVDVMGSMTEQEFKSITDLVYLALKTSYPQEDEAKMKQFGLLHIAELLEHITKINSANVTEENKAKLLAMERSGKK